MKTDQEETEKERAMRREDLEAQKELEIYNFKLSLGAFTQTKQ